LNNWIEQSEDLIMCCMYNSVFYFAFTGCCADNCQHGVFTAHLPRLLKLWSLSRKGKDVPWPTLLPHSVSKWSIQKHSLSFLLLFFITFVKMLFLELLLCLYIYTQHQRLFFVNHCPCLGNGYHGLWCLFNQY